MLEFEMVILKLPVCVRIFMFGRQYLVFETTLRVTKVEKKYIQQTKPLEKSSKHNAHEFCLV